MAGSKEVNLMWKSLRLYILRQASNPGRYFLEQTLFLLISWIPTILGIVMRGVLYRLILHIDGWAAIENGVRLRFDAHMQLLQFFTAANCSTAKSRSSFECAAEIWTRMRAFPCGTTG